jgi:hypothetical protein
MEDVCIFYGPLVYFTAIWCVFIGHFDIFSLFGMLYQEKSGNPGIQRPCCVT